MPQAEIAAEIGVPESVVRERLYRMRAKFRAKLAALGMLGVVMILLPAAFLSLVIEVSAPPPPIHPLPSASSVSAWDAGPPFPENRSPPRDEIEPFPIK